jgi:hypothetical protein
MLHRCSTYVACYSSSRQLHRGTLCASTMQRHQCTFMLSGRSATTATALGCWGLR